MPEYYYEAIAEHGEATHGLLAAESQEDLAEQLAACELTLRRVDSAAPLAGEVTDAAGAPLTEVRETLQVLSQATRNAKLRGQIRAWLHRNEATAAPAKPTDFVSALVLHGEMTGDPLSALGPLIEFERDLLRVRKDASGRFIYAYALLLFASCVFTTIDIFVGETFRTMFVEFELKLPSVTLLMLQVGPFFWSMTVTLASLPIILFLARLLFKNQFWFDRGLDCVILWGPWRRWRYSAQALAYLGSALKAEIPLPLAAELASGVLPRPFNTWQLQELGRRTAAGARLEASCFAAKVHAMVVPFLRASERQSALANGCMTAARLLLERCRRRRMFFAYFIESFAMVFVLVTAIALFTSYLLPIYSLIVALSR
jgi:type II secretory pathway component PulF